MPIYPAGDRRIIGVRCIVAVIQHLQPCGFVINPLRRKRLAQHRARRGRHNAFRLQHAFQRFPVQLEGEFETLNRAING